MSGQGNVQEELVSFRQEWRDEIHAGDSAGNSARNSPVTTEPNAKSSGGTANEKTGLTVARGSQSLEERASKLFLQGVSLEKQSKPYEAIKFYRQAIQLVPDIESKINIDTEFEGSDDEDDDSASDSGDESSFAELASMVEAFHHLSVAGHSCMPQSPPRMTHISVIPVELLMYIFKWVVSSELDFKSLECLAQVCRGFYACARDAEIWKLGCFRIWGLNCGFPLAWSGSWRLMFIQRPHVLTHGVYISKVSYVREGEVSFNLFYRPYHLVEYYRYIRFYQNGRILFLTTTEEPVAIVPKLNQASNMAMQYGHYRLMGDRVMIVVDIPTPDLTSNQGRHRRPRRAVLSPLVHNAFHIELVVQSTKRKSNSQLDWDRYTNVRKYRGSGQTVESSIDLTRQFTPLYFSPVRSFVRTADAPLT